MITADDADVSEPWIDGLALERQHAEDALIDAAQRLAADEALERLDAEREFANGERALAAEAAGAKTLSTVHPRADGSLRARREQARRSHAQRRRVAGQRGR